MEAVVSLAAKAAPFLAGALIGITVAITALRRWYASSTTPEGRDIVSSLRRVGLTSLAIAVLLTVAAGLWVASQLPLHDRPEALPAALWGLPCGLALGVCWVVRRGER